VQTRGLPVVIAVLLDALVAMQRRDMYLDLILNDFLCNNTEVKNL
jgi:hypothetical protein